jgi:hypothetical protein
MKNLLFSSFLLFFCYPTLAQKNGTDLKKLLDHFKEIKAGDTIKAVEVLKSLDKNIDKQLAWVYLKDKSGKPDDDFCHPLAYFNNSENVVVVIYSTGQKGYSVFNSIGVSSFNKKSGELIEKYPFASAFNDKGTALSEVVLGIDKKMLYFNAVSALEPKISTVKMKVPSNGKLKITD